MLRSWRPEPHRSCRAPASRPRRRHASDLHEQFSAARQYHYIFEDVIRSETESEATWFARDTDGDGQADLQVRDAPASPAPTP